MLVSAAYEEAAIKCLCINGASQRSNLRIDMPISIATDAHVDFDKYLMYVQFVVGVFNCLDMVPCASYVDDGALRVDFAAMCGGDAEDFSAFFPIVERDALVGGRYGFGGCVYDNAHLLSYAIKRACSDMYDGDFSVFQMG